MYRGAGEASERSRTLQATARSGPLPGPTPCSPVLILPLRPALWRTSVHGMFPVEQSHLRSAPTNVQLLVAEEGISLQPDMPAVERIRWEDVVSWMVVEEEGELHLRLEPTQASKRRKTVVLSTPHARKIADCLHEKASSLAAAKKKASAKASQAPPPPPLPSDIVGEELADEMDGGFTVVLGNPLLSSNGRAKKAGVAKAAKTCGQEGADFFGDFCAEGTFTANSVFDDWLAADAETEIAADAECFTPGDLEDGRQTEFVSENGELFQIGWTSRDNNDGHACTNLVAEGLCLVQCFQE
eukprot:SAG22_NODE_1471_length_4342_cov_3.522036_3_plen_299_part_00